MSSLTLFVAILVLLGQWVLALPLDLALSPINVTATVVRETIVRGSAPVPTGDNMVLSAGFFGVLPPVVESGDDVSWFPGVPQTSVTTPTSTLVNTGQVGLAVRDPDTVITPYYEDPQSLTLSLFDFKGTPTAGASKKRRDVGYLTPLPSPAPLGDSFEDRLEKEIEGVFAAAYLYSKGITMHGGPRRINNGRITTPTRPAAVPRHIVGGDGVLQSSVSQRYTNSMVGKLGPGTWTLKTKVPLLTLQPASPTRPILRSKSSANSSSSKTSAPTAMVGPRGIVGHFLNLDPSDKPGVNAVGNGVSLRQPKETAGSAPMPSAIIDFGSVVHSGGIA